MSGICDPATIASIGVWWWKWGIWYIRESLFFMLDELIVSLMNDNNYNNR